MRIAFLMLAVLGCAHAPPVDSDHVPDNGPGTPSPAAVAATLAAGSALATAAEVQAITRGDGVACWVEGGIASGLALAATVVLHPDAFPGLEVDLSVCAGLHPLPAVDVPNVVNTAIGAALGPARAAIAGLNVDCQVRSTLDAVAVWLGGLAPAVISEIEHSDGILQVAPAPIAQCGTP